LVGAYTEVMSDSNKKFPKGADFYYHKRHLYHKDWYWYFPESFKYLIISLSAITFPFFIYLIDSLLHDGAYLVCAFLIGIWLWSGMSGAKNAWWMPDRVTDELKYAPPHVFQTDFWRTKLATYGGMKVLFLIISAPINLIFWSVALSLIAGPTIFGILALDHLFVLHEYGFAIIISSGPFFFGLNAIYGKHKEFEDATMDKINDIRKSAKLRKNDDFKNLEFDIAQICNKKFTLETWLYCMAIICVELLIINFS
jgi:hypothetical protein